jgi:hypothetical protein
MKVFHIIFLMMCSVSVCHAGQVNKPHDFSAGTAAVADEVNQNFDAIVDEVNDNDTRLQKIETQLNMPVYQYSNVLGQLTSTGLGVSMEIVDVKIQYARVADAATSSRVELIIRDNTGLPRLIQNLNNVGDRVQFVLQLTGITLTLNDSFVESIQHIGREHELPGHEYAPVGNSGLLAVRLAGTTPELRNNNSNGAICSEMNFVYGYLASEMPEGTFDHQSIYRYEYGLPYGINSQFKFTMPVSTDGSEGCLLGLLLNARTLNRVDLAFVGSAGNVLADKFIALLNARPETMTISASNTGELFFTVGYAYERLSGQYDSNNQFGWDTGNMQP